MIPGLTSGKIVKELGIKMKDAYEIAGVIAEQAFSCIRMVFSYVGEQLTLERFSIAIEQNTIAHETRFDEAINDRD